MARNLRFHYVDSIWSFLVTGKQSALYITEAWLDPFLPIPFRMRSELYFYEMSWGQYEY